MVCLDCECRVLFGKLCKGKPELVEVLLGLRFNGKTDHRIRELHGLECDRMAIDTDRISCTEILESYSRTDISGLHEFDRILLVGVHLIKTCNTLFLVGPCIKYIRTCIQAS